MLVTIAKNVLLLVVFPLLEGIHCPINIKLRIIGFGTELTNIICLEINLLERILQLLLPINPFSNMLPHLLFRGQCDAPQDHVPGIPRLCIEHG